MKPKRRTKASSKELPQVQVEITGRSFHVSKPLKQLILEKSQQLPLSAFVHVVISSHKDKQGTEVHIVLSKGKETMQVKVFHPNVYTAVIQAFKKIRTGCSKLQLKKHDRIKHRHSLAEEELLCIEKEDESIENFEEEWLPFTPMDAWDSLKNFGHVPTAAKKKVSKKKTTIPMLSEQEAIQKLASSKEAALLFLNEQENKIQCVYKQHSGTYVLIDPTLRRNSLP